MNNEYTMKPWDGRFKESTKKIVDDFNASIDFDKRLYKEDIEGSIAHCKMLAKQEIISKEDADKIIEGLKQILAEIEQNKFNFKKELEDIHMNIEHRLTEIVGDIGGKLHTARSRNDQIALDIKLFLKKEIKVICGILLNLIDLFNQKAEKHIDIIMPGFTHLQQAQPILFSHHLLAYVEMFKRDFSRFVDLFKRINYSPLGSGALAGTTFNIDRFYTAKLLKFVGPTSNSIDSVSDRDSIVEFISNASLCMMHLSRLSEELIIWSSSQFNFVEIEDSYCTGSSIMPQKKNPDIPELIRGKTGRIYGNLISILTVLKGLPLAYNKDLQEDKEPLFDTVDTLKNSLIILGEIIESLKINKDNMLFWAKQGFSTATEIADYLANKGIPFREAHKITGKIVKYCIENNKDLYTLSLEEYKKFSELIEDDIFQFISVESAVERRKSFGGTCKDMVNTQIKNNYEFLKKERSFLDEI